MNTFTSWRDFDEFKHAVRTSSRFALAPDMKKFLEAVNATAVDRVEVYQKGRTFFRAQIGGAVRIIRIPHGNPANGQYTEVEERLPFDGKRMKPDPTKVEDGRANPKGIACLYLASDYTTAIAEMRPWIGDRLSVGEFKLTNDLRIVDACKGGDMREMLIPLGLLRDNVAPEKLETHIWTRIGHAFSEPTNRSDARMDYLPTQMIAERLRLSGFDGISYQSRTEDGSGRNLVLFDIEAAEMDRCTLVEIERVSTPIRNEQAVVWKTLQEWHQE